MLSSAVGGGCLTSTGIGLALLHRHRIWGWSNGRSGRRIFWLIEFLAEVLKHVRSALKRIVRGGGSAQGLNFGTHILIHKEAIHGRAASFA